MYLTHPLYAQEMAQLTRLDLPWERIDHHTVLITGATGMIGSALVDALRARNSLYGAGIRILALCRSRASFDRRFPGAQDVEPLIQDAVQPLAWDAPVDFIIHTAGNAHPLSFATQPVQTLLDSVISTRNLLEFLRAQGHGRLLYTSSGEIYGENPAVTDGYAEDSFGKIDPTSPRACYPEGKRAAETLCAAYHAQYGVDSAIARLCYVYGAPISAANSRADAQFLRRAAAGEDIILKSEGLQQRSYCYLTDAVSGIFTLLLRGESAQAYNVAGNTASIREYAQALADCAGVSLQFDLPPETERRGYSQVTRAVQRSEKLRALGWTPAYPLPDGLMHTLTIYRDITSAQE